MAWIEPHWQRVTLVSALLYPASLIFGAAAAVRRAGYRARVFPSAKLPVPVIVVGNITVGGTGKTPLVLWLAQYLRSRGRTPGIVSRGYGGDTGAARRVQPDSDPLVVGDEAVLLARRSGAETWVGADRAAAARALLAAQPGCDVLVSDDGLQHLALARDIEIGMVDFGRGFGNGWLLPAGPLREPVSRLAEVDAVVLSKVGRGAAHASLGRTSGGALRCSMRLETREFRSLRQPARRVGPEHFRGKRVHAIAGIASPERFFHHLQGMGLDFIPHSFPDHHPYAASDLAFTASDAIVMTEKDGVKCRRFADDSHWELTVDAVPDSVLGELIMRKLESAQNPEGRPYK
jgi:tetraacyldisaccharide 4'-kinase